MVSRDNSSHVTFVLLLSRLLSPLTTRNAAIAPKSLKVRALTEPSKWEFCRAAGAPKFFWVLTAHQGTSRHYLVPHEKSTTRLASSSHHQTTQLLFRKFCCFFYRGTPPSALWLYGDISHLNNSRLNSLFSLRSRLSLSLLWRILVF